MPSDRDFEQRLNELCEVDQIISETLTAIELSTEEIVKLVDTREQILQSLLAAIHSSPELAKLQQWHDAVERTQTVVELMSSKTAELGVALQKYRHGKRSVQQYQKFL
ncbi:flagellar protein FliT [Vibrio sinaloensis]|uniref:flagellar protein FliT n=1 Tax=Vibrio TaxID=662 RepID=UPI0022AF6805|nr:flagellar protein FliT [Vibrio sinaloensis]MCZ4295623.1 flagellar protein FliT [Vibrio sinaloensis]